MSILKLGSGLSRVIYNDDALDLIRVAQASKGLERYGVDYGAVDCAAGLLARL